MTHDEFKIELVKHDTILEKIREWTVPDIEAQCILALTCVMSHHPNKVTINQIKSWADCSEGSAQRNIRILGVDKHPRDNKEPYGLVDTCRQFHDRRKIEVFLTEDGLKLIEDIKDAFNERAHIFNLDMR